MSSNVQLLAFHLDGRSYAIPLWQVNRVVRAVDCTPVPQMPEIILGVIDFHGNILPVFNIRRRFGFAERGISLEDQFIIARSSTNAVALMVDSVVGIVERPEEDIVAADKILSDTDQIEGVIQFQDGLMLIHDLDRFLSLDEEQALQKALMEQPGHGS